MRQRTTWNKDRQAATSRTADDIYTMNQDHPQPSPTEYENGDPNSWAETPTKNEYVKQSYDGDSEARNEVGLPEFAPSTFDHKDSKEWGGSGKYDNQRGGMTASARKAVAAERVARAVLRTANTDLIQQQAVDFMNLPDVVLASTIKRLEAVSANALPKEIKLRRSYACCKLASAMIPGKESYASEEVWAGFIDSLGRTLMSLDDPTLKALIKSASEANKSVVAAEEEDDKDDKTASAPPKDGKEEKEDKTAAAPPKDDKEDKTAAAPMDEDCEETASAECDEVDTSCMSTEDMNMLNDMLAAPAPAPALPPAPAPAPLMDIFSEPAAAPMGVPGLASEAIDISFDGEDAVHTASDDSDLGSIFNDHEEVVAQREIRAANQEQFDRENGFQPASINRTASDSGAKKLGTVRRPVEQNDDLSGLWT